MSVLVVKQLISFSKPPLEGRGLEVTLLQSFFALKLSDKALILPVVPQIATL